MPVTGYPLPSDKTNDTQEHDDHPSTHNKLAVAVNQLSEAMDTLDGRVDSVETDDTTQDTRLTAVETVNTTQDGRLTAVETLNTAQDGRLTTLEGTSQAKTTIDAKGDLYVGSANDATGRIGVSGVDGASLTEDSTAPFGLRWQVVQSYAPWEFPVERYGAVGDDTTDDSTAFKNCMTAAVAYALAHNYEATILLKDKTYLLNTLDQHTVTGGGTNALWALPHNPATDRKLILKIRGVGASGHLLHWLQTTSAKSGSVIRTTNQPAGATTVGGVSCPPSMIGGPRYTTAFYNNLLVDIGGITVMTPHLGNIVGYDFFRVAQLKVEGGLTAITVATVPGSPAIGTVNTNGMAVGMYCPSNGNNDYVLIDSFGCEGFQTGLVPAEHMQLNRGAIIYCQDGIFYQGPGTFVHGWSISSLSMEALGRYGINVGDTAGLICPINIAAYHSETLVNFDVNDPGSHLVGDLNWFAVTRSAPTYSGAKNIRFVNQKLPRGPVTGTIAGISLPAVPASGTPISNPYVRDCMVNISGGTVTAIAVNGLTLSGVIFGSVHLPAVGTISITYSAAPTWQWAII